MNKISLFTKIDDIDKEKMLSCLSPQKMVYKKSEIIMPLDDGDGKIGYILNGKANISSIDSNGNYSIIERLSEADTFGSIFTKSVYNLQSIVTAQTKCELYFFQYDNVINRCSNLCPCHTMLINNLFQIAAQKSRDMTIRINILTQKTLRQKIVTYLDYCCSFFGSDSFYIPINLSQLAEFICADRSAMMREIKKLNEEKYILSHGTKFKLYK